MEKIEKITIFKVQFIVLMLMLSYRAYYFILLLNKVRQAVRYFATALLQYGARERTCGKCVLTLCLNIEFFVQT